jgi:hypothetical protein
VKIKEKPKCSREVKEPTKGEHERRKMKTTTTSIGEVVGHVELGMETKEEDLAELKEGDIVQDKDTKMVEVDFPVLVKKYKE